MYRMGLLALMLAACPAPAHPRAPSAAAVTLEIGRAGAALHGVAGDGERLYAALTTAGHTVIEARRGTAIAWTTPVDGTGGPLARSEALLFAAVGRTGAPIRGQPGTVVAALDAASGAIRWQLPIDATEWSVITSLAPIEGGVIVGGSFAGTLRAATKIVSSAGLSDGFVARVAASGQVAWLVRVGGAGADAVQGVAATRDRIAIAGTFTTTAELLGQPLPPFDEHSSSPDAFVAELDGKGARRWAATFGGKADEAVAGVAIDDRGRVAVAATVRDVVHVGTTELTAQGAADGLVLWLSPEGEKGATILLGGLDFDGLRAITAVGDRVVVAGFFSGSMKLGGRVRSAGGGDDAFLAAIDGDGTVAAAWQVGGPGREEITALASVPGGFIAGVAHTAAATIEGAMLPAPSDPLSGAGLVVRGL